ncbi:hypothetical protein [Pseudomonas sp. UMAB-40]|uniref:hypothetical protein n=1 Tax=Pseudomonas sp. UMAB-40 TaxID=1365407 RepID=UPI001C55B354|nr:hypothetical protein [Pseudomonas sp. UMAB-40]
MKALTKIAAFGLVAMFALANTGCTTIDKLHADAVADRAANPEKYTEIPDVRIAQLTMGEAPIYQDSCAFGCPDGLPELTRSH